MAIDFIRRKSAFIFGNKLFWASFVLSLGTLALVWAWPGPIVGGTPSDFRIRAWGMLLQLLGAYTVWRDLTGSALEFGKEGILRRNWTWFKAILRTPPTTLVSADLTGNWTISSCRVQVRPTIDKNAPVDARIEVLENYVDRLDKDVAAAFTEMGQNRRELSNEVTKEAQILHAAIQTTERRLQHALIGSYSNLAFGAFWLFVGIVLSSIAPEIAKLFAHQYGTMWIAL
jgi:hypothetical protein